MRILVTGASSGIGKATARLLADLGHEVIAAGRRREALEGQVLVEDLTNFSAAEEAVAGLRTLDAMVHCAGISRIMPLRMVTAGMCEEVMRTNWLSAVAVCKGFRRTRPSSDSSLRSIVLVSSCAAHGLPGASIYGSSKAAVATLSRGLAGELARENIRVNCVTPGWVKTPMTDAATKSLSPEQIEQIEQMQALGVGQPEEIARAIRFLLECSWATGTNLQVDGGWRLA